MRIGYGYDVHELVEERPLILGGVTIPYKKGLAGHSDADVLLHAIADALLGAAALGDIGSHFPDSDIQWKDADSMKLLRNVRQLVNEEGYAVSNVDATLAIERPRLRPHIEEMRVNIAQELVIEKERVSVKATTSEGLGYVGKGKGVTAQAVCFLRKAERVGP